MHKKLITLLILFMFISCGPQVQLHFIDVGDEQYLPKPEGYDVQVFYTDSLPEREYRVIGMVYLEDESYAIIPYLVTDPKIIKLFKIEARKKGADAIIIAKIASDTEVLPAPHATLDFGLKKVKRGEAKAIVFTNGSNAVNSNKEHLK